MNRFNPSAASRSHIARAWPIGPTLSLGVPVVQAPLGPAGANARLCAEVSRAGGLGCLTAHSPEPGAFGRILDRIQTRTPRPVLIAFTDEWESDAVLETCFDKSFLHFYVFWWNGARLAPCIRRAGGTIFWQIGSVREAETALEAGADVLVVQGTEAGGQVRTPTPLRELMESVRDAFPDVPLVAGGGLADRADVARVLQWGAAAAMMGTRFLLSDEAEASPPDKARLLRATEADLFLDARPVGSWPCAPRRRLSFPFMRDVPGLYAGNGVGKIPTVLPAREIVWRLRPPDALACIGYNTSGPLV